MVVALVVVVLGDPWKGVLVWGSRAVVGGDPWKGVVVRVCGGEGEAPVWVSISLRAPNPLLHELPRRPVSDCNSSKPMSKHQTNCLQKFCSKLFLA